MAHKQEAVHMYFELTYANYLVIPRSILQSMPDDWQYKFIKLVEECEERTQWRDNLGLVEEYSVTPVRLEYTGEEDEYDGREKINRIEVNDKFMDYERGRKQWPLKPERKKK